MAAYFKERTDRLTDDQMAKVLQLEFGGMPEVLYNLYGVTQNKDHLELADRFSQKAFLEPLMRHEDNLTGLHANTHVPKVIGAARRFEITGDPDYKSLTSFFWDRVVKTRSFATGGTSNIELWAPPYELADTLTDKNEECCVTHNLLKLTRHLICWTGEPLYADYYERALFNGILGTQGPKPGMLMYFVPMGTGYSKSFGSPYGAFWCCYGTGVESFSKLNDSIYFHDNNGIFVNLFISSELNWQDRGIELIQKSDLPAKRDVSFTVKTKKAAEFELNIRIPYWATGPVHIRLNGKPIAADCRPSAYVVLKRKWKNNDLVELTLPMNLHTCPLPDNAQKVALMYGPVVLAGILSDADTNEFPRESVETELINSSYYFLADSADDTSWLKLTDTQSLTFEASGQPYNIRFKPLNQIVNEKYGIYWPVVARKSPTHELLKEKQIILGFLKDAAKAATKDQVSQLQKTYDLLLKESKLDKYRESIIFAMGQAQQRSGLSAAASSQAKSYSEPFVARNKYWQFKTILGKSQPDKPLLVCSDLESFDGSNTIVELDGARCVATDLKNKRQLLYFSMPGESSLKNINKTVLMTLTYYSQGIAGDSFMVEYDGNEPEPYGSAYCNSKTIEKSATKGWAQITVELPKARFSGKQNLESDFRINALSDGDEYISDIRIVIK
jgi:hypothetical protein